MNPTDAGTLDFDNDFDSRVRAGFSALANRDRNAIADLIRYERASRQPAQGVELRGLLLLGGRGDVAFDDDNPWGVPAGSGLPEALQLIWSPVADRCPDFVATVMRETLALALVREADRYLLGYLFLNRLGDPEAPPCDPEAPPRDLDELREAGTDSGRLAWVWGGPPVHHDTTRHVGVLGRPVPAPVRDLARIHSCLDGEGSIDCDSFDETLGSQLLDETRSAEPYRYPERIATGVYDRYVHIGDWGPDAQASFLNLDNTDCSGDPRVATYSFRDDRIYCHEDFWDWFNCLGPLYLFACEDYL